ncbi:hypothetical protein N9W41_01165 [bacterium]|nr:hypothetical protein [bacterium]
MGKTKAKTQSKSKTPIDKAKLMSEIDMDAVEASIEKRPLPLFDEVIAKLGLEVPENEEIIITDAEGRQFCKIRDCDQTANVNEYCRYHYLMLWKNIQSRKKILEGGNFESYVSEQIQRYPDKFLEVLAKDLVTERDFISALHELKLDDDIDFEEDSDDDDDDRFNEEVQGVANLKGKSETEY